MTVSKQDGKEFSVPVITSIEAEASLVVSAARKMHLNPRVGLESSAAGTKS